ncbi:MAG: hypothetical protein ACJASM_002747 [Salibacteraceae bacterium]|jgi:hypothetical protein
MLDICYIIDFRQFLSSLKINLRLKIGYTETAVKLLNTAIRLGAN